MKIKFRHYFLFFFGDLDKSFSLGNAHASMAMRSFNHDFIIHEALALVLSFIILEKLPNRLSLEKTVLILFPGGAHGTDSIAIVAAVVPDIVIAPLIKRYDIGLSLVCRFDGELLT